MYLRRVFFAIQFLFSVSFLFAQRTNPTKDVDGVTESWYAHIQENLLKQEYNLHLKKDKHYRAFNRSNNIIGQLKPGVMSLTPNLDNGQTTVSWQAELQTASIVFDGDVVYIPTQTALITSDENTVEFHHDIFTEQYINNEQGLRQNFIIHEGPDSDEIQINLNINGLKVVKRHDTELAFYEETRRNGIQIHTLYKDLKSWDANGIPLASHFEVMGNQVSIVVNPKNATYPITIDPISTTVSSTLEENKASALYGYSVSSAGDVNGDGYDDVIVGAPYYDNGQNKGAAFVYFGSKNGISTTSRILLKISNNGLFGYSVSSAGDVNGDGYDDIIVGASEFENGQTREGAAFIFHGTSSGISTTPSIQLEINQAYALTGSSVSNAGDVNGDGYDDVVIGAPFYNISSPYYEGATAVFLGSSNGILSSSLQLLKGNQSYAYFGTSVSTAGDINSDGYDDLIVGAPSYDNGQTNEGVAFVFYGTKNGISANSKSQLEINKSTSFFGCSVSSAGDVNGDSFDDVIIGADYYENGQTQEGAIFLFHGSGSGINLSPSIKIESNGNYINYGRYVSNVKDLNNDGYDEILTTGRNSNIDIFYGSKSGITTSNYESLKFNFNSYGLNGERPVSSAGDVNNDGLNDIVVGHSEGSNGQSREGMAFMFYGVKDTSCTTTSSTDTITSCGPYTWTDGKTYTTSNNTAKDTFINAAGCDSMVSLNLTILQLPTITGSSSVCISDTIILTATSPIGTVDIFPPWVSSNVNVATVVDGVVKGISEGSTVLTFYAPNGCSVSQIITVLPSSYDTLTFLECDSVISPTGKVYTSTGSYNDTLVNSFGCDSVITSLVTIGDTISPTALTQNLTLYLNQLGQVSTSSSDVNNGSSDNCGITFYRLSDSIFDCTDLGTNTIYLIVTDRYGNIDSASAVVTVQDTIKPKVLTQNVTVSLDASGAGSVTVADIDNGSTDNCSIASSTLSKTSFDCLEVGANTVYLIVNDVNGNTDSASAVVIVQDTIKPTVLTQNVTVSLDASGAGSVTVGDIDNGSSDNCSIASRTLSKTSFDCSNVGANTIYLIVTDVNGNIDSASAVVTVQDIIKPTVLTQNVTVSLDVNGAGSVNVADIDNGSTDNCSIATSTLSKSTFDCSEVGANTIYLIVTDVNGNIDSASAVVKVQDIIKPTVLTQNVTVSLDASGAGSVTVADIDNGSTDNCSIASRTLSKSTFDCSEVGANTIYLIVTDANGNIDSASAVVTVQDVIKPTVVTTPSDIALGYCDATYRYAIPTGDDNCGVTVTQIAGLPPGSTFPVGLTVNTFEISDPSGNTVTTSFTVDIRARYMPFATPDTSICNNNNKIDLSKGFDNIIFIGSGVEANKKFFNPNSLEPGSYTITAEFTDSMGCVSMDTLEVTLRIIPIVPVIERVASDQIVTADTYSSYQWYRNGEELNGKNGYHLRVHELGLYSVLVGNTENCFVGSEGYGFGIPVDEENVTNQENVKVYPNPTAGFLFVEMSDGDTLHTLSLTNNLGDVVLSKETNTAIARIDMNSLLPGTYYLQVNSFSTNVFVKIVKL